MGIAVSIAFSLLFLVIIVLFVAGASGIKKLSETDAERGHEMIKTVYVYLVLFATLMMTIGGTVAAFMSIADLISPTGYYQSFEDYKLMQLKQEQTLTDAELKSQYDQMVANEKRRIKERAINSLIKSFGWIVIPLPVFLYFQRRVKDQPV
ncbi:MAG: hypothetical protein GX755_04375 [Syntrophomonadaceae bacterium]|nr:hypothetical protein [Syntrophomonadaceae bacterium]